MLYIQTFCRNFAILYIQILGKGFHCSWTRALPVYVAADAAAGWVSIYTNLWRWIWVAADARERVRAAACRLETRARNTETHSCRLRAL